MTGSSERWPQRILTTGASGNIGTAVLRRLAADGADVEIVGVARRLPPGQAPYDIARWHSVDLADVDAAEQLAPLMIGVDVVVHLAWGFQPTRDVDYLRRTGVGGTGAVVRAAAHAGVAHLVHMSSVGAYTAAIDERRVTEQWPTGGVPTSPYSQHKSAAERLLDAAQAGFEMTVTRMRPGFVLQRAAASGLLRYGLPGNVPAALLRWLPVLPLDRKLLIPVIHADDVADAIVAAMRRRVGGAFNLAAEPPLTRADIAEALGARPVQVPARVLSAPAATCCGTCSAPGPSATAPSPEHPVGKQEEDTMVDAVDGPDAEHRAPQGTSAETVSAVGKVSEALEALERARGHLYSFHQLIGGADLALGAAVQKLRDAGHHEQSERLASELVGRNVLAGRWSFQVVEEFDDGYWTAFRHHERRVREELVAGRRHLFEAQMKEDRRTPGLAAHEARPVG